MAAPDKLRDRFQKNLLDLIKENLRELNTNVIILESFIDYRDFEETRPESFEKMKETAQNCCRRIMGNLELLPSPSTLKRVIIK